MAVAPVLAGSTLADVASDGYAEKLNYRGVQTEMASGAVVTDLVTADVKIEFTLSWTMITIAERVTIDAALEVIKSSYAASNFTAPTGTVYTVTRDGGISWSGRAVADGLRWDGTLKLREV